MDNPSPARRNVRRSVVGSRREAPDADEPSFGAGGGSPRPNIQESGRFAEAFLGDCPAIRELLTKLKSVARRDATILLIGEPGTGKEVLAQAVHAWSGRRGQMVALNVANLSGQLLDAELFGHLKGAFTNASHDRQGLVATAERGTLFLDEIGELAFELQPKMLRFIQERSVRPIGGDQERPVDVRLIAATNQRLTDAVGAGRFRRDLYDRLAEFVFHIPPLRERGDDVLLLANHYLKTFAEDRAVRTLTRAAIRILKAHPWPGNVRELQRVIRALVEFGAEQPISEAEILKTLDHPVMAEVTCAPDAIKLLELRGTASADDLAARLRISSSTVRRQLQPLRKAGNVEMRRIGREMVYRWVATGGASSGPVDQASDDMREFQESANPNLETDQDSAQALRGLAIRLAREQGRVSRHELAMAAGVSLRSASRMLTALHAEGKLDSEGGGRSRRYLPVK